VPKSSDKSLLPYFKELQVTFQLQCAKCTVPIDTRIRKAKFVLDPLSTSIPMPNYDP
jgi:hypothetical protein